MWSVELNSIARLVLGVALAWTAYALPLHLAAPCGQSRIAHVCVWLAFGVGAWLGATRFTARVFVAAALWILSVVVEREYGHALSNWGLSIARLPSSGTLPFPLVLSAVVFALPIGAAAASMLCALPGRALPLAFGAAVATALAPLLTSFVVGVRGVLALSCVAIALAAWLSRAGENDRVRPQAEPDRTVVGLVAVALGIVSPVLTHGAGGTAFGAVFSLVLALAGCCLGSLLREVRRPHPIVAACSIAALIAALAAAWPSVEAIDFAAHRIAASQGGNLPTLSTLAPLPFLVIALGAMLGWVGIVGHPRTAVFVLLLAVVGSILPRGGFESRVELLALAVVGLLVATRASMSSSRRGERLAWPQLAIALACALLAIERGQWAGRALSHEISAVGEFGYELDGTRFDSSAVDGEAPEIRFDGIAIPFERVDSTTRTSLTRLLAQALAYSDAPARCLVIGPGARGLVEALIEVADLDLTIVTPLRGEARALKQEYAGRRRTRIVHAVPRAFLSAQTADFDRILVASPQPAWHEYGWNRTHEFRELVVQRLSAGGVAAETFALSSAQVANSVSRFITEAMLDRTDGLLILDHPRSALPWVAALYGPGVQRIHYAALKSRLDLGVGSVEVLARASFDVRSVLQFCIADSRRFRLDGRLAVRNTDDRSWLAVSAHSRVLPDRTYAFQALAALTRLRASIETRIEFDEQDSRSIGSRVRADHDATTSFLSWRADALANCAADAIDPPGTASELDAMLRALRLSPDLPWLRSPLLRSAAGLVRSGSRLEARLLLERLAAAERDFAVRPERNPSLDPVFSRLALARFLARSGFRARALAEFEALPSGEHDRVVEFERACLDAMAGRARREASIPRLEQWLAEPALSSADRAHAEFALAFAKRDRDGLVRGRGDATDAKLAAAQRYAEMWLEQ